MKLAWDIQKIDAHVHLNVNRLSLLEYGRKNNFRYVSINTDIPFFDPTVNQQNIISSLQEKHGNQISFASSFSMSNWGSLNWEVDTIKIIEASLKAGAIGVKVWKNIGMDVRDAHGRYIGLDHPSFDSIFNFLEESETVVLGHTGEPKNCWLPLNEMTVEQDRAYFQEHPEYHMYLYPKMPSYQDHLDARNRRLEMHPKLKFVGLHLASHEWSVNEVAGFLDTFPLASVDLAERICHLQHQSVSNWKKVYDFFIKYQDRIIYGTDVIDDGKLSDQELIDMMEERYKMHWRYFTTNEEMKAPKVSQPFRGLELPEAVIRKIYYENAMNSYELPELG